MISPTQKSKPTTQNSAQPPAFLFTDVEGSTALWEHHPAWMAQAHARHEAILREAIAAHAGQVRQQIGDAFQAAFPTAAQALAAAVAAQRALAAEPWPPLSDPDPRSPTSDPRSPALRVRMALAPAAPAEDDLALLRRLDALLPAGNGGQILLPAPTADLVRATLPPGVWLRDLGTRQLKNQTTPAHVWQAVVPDAGDQFRPLRLTPGRPHNLPRQLTSFIGREREATEVAALLRHPATRLVTLTGPGGIGKTRLSLQVAADLLDECADGVWFVDLAALIDPALVLATIAGVLGVREQVGTPIAETLAVALVAQHRLLVLDNFEQLLPAASDLTALLAATRHLRLLVSSRAPLARVGETRYPVPPLPTPDPAAPAVEQLAANAAVRLFVERAWARAPAFALTAVTAPAVAAVCAGLDGLPLAIELAAARVADLGLDAVRAGLDEKLDLLAGRLRGRPARQQTLRGAITWSYDLLPAGARQLFRRMAAFQGGSTAAALDMLYPDDGAERRDLRGAVQALLDHSLLLQRAGRDGAPRFEMLETIHEFAREQLAASGEEAALRDGHLAYFTALAEQAATAFHGPLEITWLARLDAEHDNLRAALAWARQAAGRGDADAALQGLTLAGRLAYFWDVRGHIAEGRETLAAAVSPAPPTNADADVRARWRAARARALMGASTLARLQGDFGAAEALLGQSLALWRELGDGRGIADALAKLAWVAHMRDDLAVGVELATESLALRRSLGDTPGIAEALWMLGSMAMPRGDTATAGELLTESLQLFRQLGDLRGIASALNHLGAVARHRGDYPTARRRADESVELARQLGDVGGIPRALSYLANLAMHQGDYAAARALYEELLPQYERLGEQASLGAAVQGLAFIALMQGDYASARRWTEQGLAVKRTLGQKGEVAVCLNNLGNIEFMEGAYGLARSRFLESLALFRAVGVVHDSSASLGGLGAVAALQGAPARGARLLGASDGLLAAQHIVREVDDALPYDRGCAAARAALGDDGWEAAYRAGQALSLDEAIALALEAAPAETPPP